MSGTTTLGTSGQGGYLLPAGYLSTSGNQIVDANGNPVRIDSIGWNGTDGAAGSALQGLYAASYQTIMNAIKADGFNTIRIPWSDVALTSMPASSTINYSLNPGLQGLNTLQIFQQIVAYAGQVGLKIIFDHHTDDGGPNGWGGQQANGLWFDSGPGSDGTDGSGTTGTVTAAKFEQDWVTLASTFKGNSTVIGYDLDNEPTSAGNINWGQGGPTDIQAMYTTVGNAVEAADPGALIIAEGPEEYNAPGAGSGMSANVAAPEGDLTGVATDPVTLNTPNKVVYSVHEYPSTISGTAVDSGSAYIQELNAAWGYLETQNIAPVWIGEMGGSLDGTAESAGSGLANEQAWASTLLNYMNGQDGAQGGPTFTGNQQPISGSWWLAGAESGQFPDGIQSAYGQGNYRAGQQAITDQMIFVPKGTSTPVPPASPSANDTVVRGTAGAITDANGNIWTITSTGQVAVNGITDTTTANVIELAYVQGTIWQENSSHLWWGETTPNASWAPESGTATSPLPATPAPSPNVTVVQANSTAAITDASGNQWTITGAGQVAVNGTPDTTTANVIELAYVNGTIWQENTSLLWWGETKPNASWATEAGTTTSPLPALPLPSPNDTVIKANGAGGLIDASGNKWTITPNAQVAVNGVADTTTANVTELVYVNGEIWQENSSNLWKGKTSPTAAWSPGTGTSKSPLSSTVIIAQGQTNELVSQSYISVVATSGDHMVFISGSGDTLKLSGGTNTITDTGRGNTYVIPAAGNGYDTFTSNILTAGATLELRTALGATNWNGSASTLSKYLNVTDTIQGAVLSISHTSGGTGVAIAMIDGATTANLSTVLAHSLI
jgi:endoglucanase